MTLQCKVDAFPCDQFNVDGGTRDYLRLLTRGAGLEYLIDGAVQPFGVGEHDIVKAAALVVSQRARLQRFQVQPDRRDRRFQLVSDRVDEGVVLLVASDFENEKDGVDDETGDDHAERDDAEDEDPQRRAFGGDDDPADIQRDRRRDEEDAEGDEKRDRLLASGHEVILGQATASSAPTTVSSVSVVCATFATFTFHASPRSRSALMPIQFRSSSYQARPWRAETGCAWWLLCQPSPNVMSATHQLLVESSRVVNRREPHKWVAEFTSQV